MKNITNILEEYGRQFPDDMNFKSHETFIRQQIEKLLGEIPLEEKNEIGDSTQDSDMQEGYNKKTEEIKAVINKLKQ